MRKTAFALLFALGLCASEYALAQKSPLGAAAARASPPPAASGGHRHHGGHHHHHRSFVGVGVGFSAYPWGWYPPPAYPYYVPVAEQPVTWLEQDAPPVSSEPASWYYCEASTGYYPNVRECPSGWTRVPAQ